MVVVGSNTTNAASTVVAPKRSVSFVTVLRRIVSLLLTVAIAVVVIRVHQSGAQQKPVHPIFLLHPVFMTLFSIGALPEVLSTVAALRRRKEGKAYLVYSHQLSTSVLQLSGAIGLGSIVYVKEQRGKAHFTSTHGLVGLGCAASLAIQTLLGILLRFRLHMSSRQRRWCTGAHKLMSLLITIGALLAFSGGVLSTSYAKEVMPSDNVRAALVAMIPLVMFLAFI